MSFENSDFKPGGGNDHHQGQNNTGDHRGSSQYGGGHGGGSDGGGYNRGGYNPGGGGGYNRGGYSQGGGGGFGKGNFQKGGYSGGGYNRGGFQKEEEQGPIELYKPYVGTGNREVPPHVIDAIKRVSELLEKDGYTMRSNGMEGAGDYFEKSTTKSEIHLPWKEFNGKQSKFQFTTNQAKDIAALYQPGFEGLKPVIQTFLGTNVRMVMGKDLKSPALFVITWSEDGAETLKEKSIKTGNTGHVIAIAAALRIPVFNLARPDAEARLKLYLNIQDGQTESTESPAAQSAAQPVQQPATQSTGASNYGY